MSITIAELAELVTAAGMKPRRDRLEKLMAYLELLNEQGRRLGLAAGSAGRGVWPHLVKSVFLAAEVFHVKHLAAKGWADLGSGGGIPCLPVRILLGELPLTALEPRLKRSIFLQEAARRLDLRGVSVRRQRAEETAKKLAGTFALCTAQGFGPLEYTMEKAGPLLMEHGLYLGWRGSDLETRLKRCGKRLVSIGLRLRKNREINFAEQRWANIMIVEKVGKD